MRFKAVKSSNDSLLTNSVQELLDQGYEIQKITTVQGRNGTSVSWVFLTRDY
jgi:hypothetical protein